MTDIYPLKNITNRCLYKISFSTVQNPVHRFQNKANFMPQKPILPVYEQSNQMRLPRTARKETHECDFNPVNYHRYSLHGGSDDKTELSFFFFTRRKQINR